MDAYIGSVLIANPQCETSKREEALAKWQESPAWGGDWRSFFDTFSRCVRLKQPGVTVTDLWGWTYGDTPSTVPQIREALQEAMDAGLVIRLLDERPDGTREYYGLNPESWVLSKIMERPSGATLPTATDQAVQAVQQFAQLSFNDLAIKHEFAGSSLTAEQVITILSEGPCAEGSCYKTALYNCTQLYPTGINKFVFSLRGYIDDLVDEAVRAGVMEVEGADGERPRYSLTEGVAELHQSYE